MDRARLLELLLGLGEAVIVIDEFGRIEFFNHEAEDLFGYRGADIVGQNLEILIPEQSRKRHADSVEKFAGSRLNQLQMGGRTNIRGLHKNGTEFLTRAAISRVVDRGKTLFIANLMNQSEVERLVKAEGALADTQRITHLGSWNWNVETGNLWWSDEIYRIVGQEPGSFAATYDAFLEMVHPDDRGRVTRAVDAALNKKRDYRIVHRLVRADGEIRNVREIGEVQFDEGGTAIRMVGTVHDITEQIQMEARLVRAQKLESVGKLTGGIAHDFNNLLMVILGNLELIRTHEEGLRQPLSELIDDASKAAERGSKLTQRLLAFSSRQSLVPETIDLREMVREMDPVLRQSLGGAIEIEVVGGGGLWRCETDLSQLENVLLNLAINARDAMPGGGKLTIETGNASLDDEFALHHSNIRPGQYVLLSVSDTGHGMTPEVAAQAFDPFFTTKEQGSRSGLGLSMVYGFVRQAGGCVEIYSEVNEGTTVKVYLPRTMSTLEKRHRPRTIVGEPQGAGECILVVDDESAIRKLTVELLRRLGYRTFQAEGPEEALEILESAPEIRLLLTDVMLPGGKSGAWLANEAQHRWPGLLVLYMSGYTENAIVHSGRLDQGVELLEKPFTKAHLAHKVRGILGRSIDLD